MFSWRFRSRRHGCYLRSLLYEQKRHKTGTSRSHTSKIVPERLVERVWGSKSQSSVDSSPRSYLSTSATVRISVHTALKSGTEPIRYMTFHFRDRRGAPSPCYKNRAKILVFANKRECCKLTCGISRQETRSHMEVYRTYFKWVEFEILGSSLSLAWEIRLSKGTHLRHNPLLWYTNLIG